MTLSFGNAPVALSTFSAPKNFCRAAIVAADSAASTGPVPRQRAAPTAAARVVLRFTAVSPCCWLASLGAFHGPSAAGFAIQGTYGSEVFDSRRPRCGLTRPGLGAQLPQLRPRTVRMEAWRSATALFIKYDVSI